MAQIRQVVSESLQATIRDLLPSQQGFTEDLQASNVITPIIDLTPSAEGSTLQTDLQQALNFGGATAHSIANTTSTIINSPGFYRVTGVVNLDSVSATLIQVIFRLSDGLTTKIISVYEASSSSSTTHDNIPFDYVFFLAAGESLTCQSTNVAAQFVGSSRQIADVNGNLVNPSGFSSS